MDGASGDWTAHLLTNKHKQKQEVVKRFMDAWRKPTAETGQCNIDDSSTSSFLGVKC